MPATDLSRTQNDPSDLLEDAIKVALIANPVTQLPTLFALVLFNPFTARRIDGADRETAFVNVEKEVRFTVFDQSIAGSKVIADAPVTFVLGATKGAGLSKTSVKDGGEAKEKSVTVNTGPDGVAVAYLLGGELETITLTGQTPNSVTTVEARTRVEFK